MRFSQNFLFLAPNRSHLPVAWYTRLRIGAIFRLWHQNWCRFRERNFCRGIKIDAILITSSLIPSRSSHLARVFSKILFPLPIPSGKWQNWGCFSKISLNFLTLNVNPYTAPSLIPCLKAILWTPSLIPSGKGHFLSSFQKNFRSFNPHLETVLSTYPAKISPTIPYSNFCGWKTTWFLTKFPHTPIPQL